MLAFQVVVSFAFWILFGWFLAKKASGLRARVLRLGRPFRTALGPLLLIIGAGVLLGGMKLVAAIHGLEQGSFTVAGWVLATLVGVLFVGAQGLGALMVISLAIESEPTRIVQASDRRINE